MHSYSHDTNTIYKTYEVWEKNTSARRFDVLQSAATEICLLEWVTGESEKAGPIHDAPRTIGYI
jgi:hypothetical protein